MYSSPSTNANGHNPSSNANPNNPSSTNGPQQTAVPGSGRIGEVQQQVEDVKIVMSQNVSRILERGERLDNLDQQSQALQESAQVFSHTGQRVQRAFWLRHIKWTVVFVIVMLLLAVILLLTLLKLIKVI